MSDGATEYGRPYQRFDLRKKMFRRRKKLVGDDITDEMRARLEAAQRADKGVYCRGCGKWRRWNEVEFAYDLVVKTIIRRWNCKRCGNQIKEDEL